MLAQTRAKLVPVLVQPPFSVMENVTARVTVRNVTGTMVIVNLHRIGSKVQQEVPLA